MDPSTPNPDARRRWTPEQTIQAFKEGVTAVLGLLLVIATLIMAWQTFHYAGDQAKLADAKDVLLLVLGLSGVVIGYYFGRVPADARTTQAQEQAQAATSRAEGVGAQAEAAAAQLDPIIARLAAPADLAARGAAAAPDESEEVAQLKRVRAMLRDVATLAQRRS